MPDRFSPEVEKLIKQHMATGLYQSERELLLAALHALAQRRAAALTEAIHDMEAGDTGRPLTQVAKEIRAKHSWSEESE